MCEQGAQQADGVGWGVGNTALQVPLKQHLVAVQDSTGGGCGKRFSRGSAGVDGWGGLQAAPCCRHTGVGRGADNTALQVPLQQHLIAVQDRVQDKVQVQDRV